MISPAYADDTQIEMDWLVEGQIADKQSITSLKKTEIVSSYEGTIENDLNSITKN